jgi:hypothetical protein
MNISKSDYQAFQAQYGTFVEAVIDMAQKQGWNIYDLNNNSQGLRVKGASWVAQDPEGEIEHYWNRDAIALNIAGVVMDWFNDQPSENELCPPMNR